MTEPTPAVDVEGDVVWLNTCYEMDGAHHHISPYLVDTDRGWVLVEAGSIEHQDELLARVEALTDGDGPAAAILSHYDLPHVANARRFREEWDFDLYTSFSGTSASPEALGMGSSEGCMHEETKEICGREFTFPWPPLVDAAHSMWVYEHASKTMFVADVGHYHSPGTCAAPIADQGSLPGVGRIRAYNRDALPFVPYLDPDKVASAFADLLDAYDVEVWAPVHGNPIVGSEHIETYIERYVEAIADPAEPL